MSIGLRLRIASLGCAAVLAALALPAGAAAADGSAPLGPELAKLAKPSLATEPPAVQDEAVALPTEGPGGIVREGDRVVVEAHFEAGAAARREALEEAGADVLSVSRRYQTAALSVAPEELVALAEVPGLASVRASLRPVIYGAGEAVGTAATGGEVNCEGGSVISEGLQQMNVAAARGAFGARGAGETIGVLSDSFNKAKKAITGGTIATHERQDEESGDLPGPHDPCLGQQVPVQVVKEAPVAGAGEEFTDEGRAMLQVLHDLAPHAELAFATAYSTEVQFAENIEKLAAPSAEGGAEANVIVDDVGYFAEPYYQEGPVADAIQKVTAEGVTYLTAGGNDNLVDGAGNEFASWEREEFVDAECPQALGETVLKVRAAESSCLDFSPTGSDPTFGITIEPESTLTVDLQWAEPWYGNEADLNAYLLDAEAEEVLVDETIKNVGVGVVDHRPVELFGWENESSSPEEVQLVVDRCIELCNTSASSAAKPRLKVILMENGSGVSEDEYPKSDPAHGITVGPTVYGHAGSTAAITLGAVPYTESATTPEAPEEYSSRGPVVHLFGPVDGNTPASPLPAEEVIEKPNLTATDCASTTFFASFSADGHWHFCGTSEAGPHAAAVAALMKQAEPSATPAAIVEAMEESATPFTVENRPQAVGAGMLNAKAAIEALGGAIVTDDPGVGSATEGPAESTSPVFHGQIESGGATTSTAAAATTTSTPADTTPPHTTITGPKKVVRTHLARVLVHFTLTADESPVTFRCEFDRGPLRPCGPEVLHRFGAGDHLLRVWTEDAAGNVGEAPAVYRFRVKRTRR